MASFFFSANGSRIRKPSPIKVTTPSPDSLETFVLNIFYDALIQDQDNIAEITYNRGWSRKVKEIETGNAEFNFEAFHKLLFDLRAQISNRQLVSQFALASPDDEEGLTGQVAHRATFTGVQEGKQITSTIIAVAQIGLEQGERKIEIESFIMESDFQPVPKAESLALQAQLKSAIYTTFIVDQNDIFELGFDTFFSRKASVTGNNTTSNFEEYKKLVQQTREQFTHRFITGQDLIVTTIGAQGKTAQAGHWYSVQGVENGKPVVADFVTVSNIDVENGQSKLLTETSFAVFRDL